MKKLVPLNIINHNPKREKFGARDPEHIYPDDRVKYNGSVFNLMTHIEQRYIVQPGLVNVIYDQNTGGLIFRFSDGSEKTLNGFITPQQVKFVSAAKVGEEGLKGKRGRRGRSARDGREGSPGAVGIKGNVGQKGSPGDRGSRGPIGEKGIAGKDADIGPVGFKGLTGNQGADGYKGLTGSAGIPGRRGKKGSSGLRGIRGEQGPNGCRGEIGMIGPKGDTGKVGKKGPDGECELEIPGKPGLDGKDGIDSLVNNLIGGENVGIRQSGADFTIYAHCRPCGVENPCDNYPGDWTDSGAPDPTTCDGITGDEITFDFDVTTDDSGQLPSTVPPGVPVPGACDPKLYPAVGASSFIINKYPTFCIVDFVGADLGYGSDYEWKLYIDNTIFNPPEGTVYIENYHMLIHIGRDMESFLLKAIRKDNTTGCISEGSIEIPSLYGDTVDYRYTTTTAPITSPPWTTRPPFTMDIEAPVHEYWCDMDVVVMLDVSDYARNLSQTVWIDIVNTLKEQPPIMGDQKVRLGVVVVGYQCFVNNTESSVFGRLRSIDDEENLNELQRLVDMGFASGAQQIDLNSALKDLADIGWAAPDTNTRCHLIIASSQTSRESFDIARIGEQNDDDCVAQIANMAVARKSFRCDVIGGLNLYHEQMAMYGRGERHVRFLSTSEWRAILSARGLCPLDSLSVPTPPYRYVDCDLDICLVVNTTNACVGIGRQLLDTVLEVAAKYPYIMGENGKVRLATVCFNDLCYIDNTRSVLSHDFIDAYDASAVSELYAFTTLEGFNKTCYHENFDEDAYAAFMEARSLSWQATTRFIFMVTINETSSSISKTRENNGDDLVSAINAVNTQNGFHMMILHGGYIGEWMYDAVEQGLGRVEMQNGVPDPERLRAQMNICVGSTSTSSLTKEGGSYALYQTDYYRDRDIDSMENFLDFDTTAVETSHNVCVWDFIDQDSGCMKVTIFAKMGEGKENIYRELGYKIFFGRKGSHDFLCLPLPEGPGRLRIEVKLLDGQHHRRLLYSVNDSGISEEIDIDGDMVINSIEY